MSQLIDTVQDRSHVFLILRYEKNGSLLDYLNHNPLLDINAAQKIIVDVVCGLAHLHTNNMIHGDMKPENVFLDGNLRAHIGDFGMVLPTNANDIWYGPYGTQGYQAPEQMAGNVVWDHRVDYFVVGIILIQMITGQHPFGTSLAQIGINVHKLRFIMPPLNDEAESFVRKTICNLDDRFNCINIMKHSFISGIVEERQSSYRQMTSFYQYEIPTTEFEDTKIFFPMISGIRDRNSVSFFFSEKFSLKSRAFYGFRD